MEARQFFSVLYTLMAEEAGGRPQLETGLAKFQSEMEMARLGDDPGRFDPDVELPKVAASSMADFMKMAPPAKRRDE